MGVSLKIVLNQQNIAFRPGDIVAGHVVVRNNGQSPVHFDEGFSITFYGEELVVWTKHSCIWIPFVMSITTTKTYRDGKVIVAQSVESSNTSTIKLEQGESRFPFRFKLPPGAPSSYVSISSKESVGHVRYYVMAELKTSSWYKSNEKETCFIPVLGHAIMDSIPGQAPVTIELNCRNVSHGLSVELPKLNWVPGDWVPFTIRAFKDKPFTWNPKVTLWVEEYLTTRTGYTTKPKTEYLAHVGQRRQKGAPKEKGIRLEWVGDIMIPVDAVLSNLGGASFIRVNYFMNVSGTGIDNMKIPIMLCTGFYGQQAQQAPLQITPAAEH